MLVIGKEAIDVKAAKRKVLSNLRLLNSRLQGLCMSSPSFDALHAFYSQKVEEQLNILEWFEHPRHILEKHNGCHSDY